MDADKLLQQITIPVPCPVPWDSMTGDARVRMCADCGKEVHNFAELTPREAAALVTERGDHLCGLLTHRSDGSLVMASDCAPEQRPSPFRFTIRSIMVVVAGVAAVLGFGRVLAVREPDDQWPVTQKRMIVTAGKVCLKRPVSPPVSTSGTPATNKVVAGRLDVPSGEP
jgi:hypothetical protein